MRHAFVLASIFNTLGAILVGKKTVKKLFMGLFLGLYSLFTSLYFRL